MFSFLLMLLTVSYSLLVFSYWPIAIGAMLEYLLPLRLTGYPSKALKYNI